MKARQLIEGTSYGPEALNAMTQAFDQAWSVIAGNISRDTSEAARQRLANALLSVATDDSRDAKALKRKALEAMALSYYAVPSDSSPQTLPTGSEPPLAPSVCGYNVFVAPHGTGDSTEPPCATLRLGRIF